MTGAAATTGPLRCISIDVEDYYHIEAAFGRVARSNWASLPGRVSANVDFLLERFAEHNQHGTFFMLGDAASRHPGLALRIAQAGHEIACHGYAHDHLIRLNRESFRHDVLRAKQLLEDQTGQAVIGYRAPTFSVTRRTSWAVEVLLEAGFRYDSSVFPVRHPAYGEPKAPRRPFMLQGDCAGALLLETPPLTWRVAGRNLPVAGGGYFRLLPLWLMQRGLAQAAAQNRPAILYFHPWEFDPAAPRLPLSLIGRWRTYTGLKTAARKLDRIMSQPAQWSPICKILDHCRAQAQQHAPFYLCAA